MTSVLASDCIRRLCARERYNLNAISHDSAIGLIRMVIARGFNVTEVRASFSWLQPLPILDLHRGMAGFCVNLLLAHRIAALCRHSRHRGAL